MRWGKPMNLRSPSRDEPEINLTSLIDVVLLLLVFFMITTSFVRESKIGIRLPSRIYRTGSDSERTPGDHGVGAGHLYG